MACHSLVLLLIIVPTVYSLTCTVCEFSLLPPYSTNCNETCEGDVCFIVVNKFFNGTINAGCMHLREGDKFEQGAACHRTSYDNRCACDTKDKCNDPNVKLSTYTFSEKPVMSEYQWLPQIQPPMPALQPIEGLPEDTQNTNETVAELEAGIQSDMEKVLDENKSNETSTENSSNEDDSVLTVTTTVGLNVRENMTDVDKTTQKPSGIGSIEMTKVTENHGPRALATMRPTLNSDVKSTNMTSDGVDDEEPNSSNSLYIIPSLILLIVSRIVLV